MNKDPGSTHETAEAVAVIRHDIRHLSPIEFARLGLSQIAYVRPVLVEGSPAFAIHGADGQPLAVAPSHETAIAAIVEHEMMPISIQ
jgi:hypothetical protein